MISKRVIKMQKDLYLCFIHYAKQLIRYKDLSALLEKLDLIGKAIRIKLSNPKYRVEQKIPPTF